jgi:ankyrin repeat protein
VLGFGFVPDSSAAKVVACCIPQHEWIQQCIETLHHVIEYGANPNFSDNQGSTLAEFCRGNLTQETSALVLKLFSQHDVIRSQLIECVASNDSGSLIAVIQQHSISEAVDEHGLNLIFLAARLGHLSCFQVLFRSSAAPHSLRNYSGLSPMHVAASRGRTAIISFLIECGEQRACVFLFIC